MSERYGDCKLCKGKGYLIVEDGEDLVQKECPRCGGTGQSGDAMDKE